MENSAHCGNRHSGSCIALWMYSQISCRYIPGWSKARPTTKSSWWSFRTLKLSLDGCLLAVHLHLFKTFPYIVCCIPVAIFKLLAIDKSFASRCHTTLHRRSSEYAVVRMDSALNANASVRSKTFKLKKLHKRYSGRACGNPRLTGYGFSIASLASVQRKLKNSVPWLQRHRLVYMGYVHCGGTFQTSTHYGTNITLLVGEKLCRVM